MLKLFQKNFDTLAIAILFVAISFLLEQIGFWGAIGLPNPGFPFIFIGLLFLAVVVLFSHTIFEPFVAIADERFEQTEGKRKNAEKKRQEADAMIEEYEKGLLDAKMKAFKEREQISLQGEEEERKKIEAARTKSQENLEVARKEMAQQVEKTKTELIQSKDMLVNELVEKILDSPSTKKVASPKPRASA